MEKRINWIAVIAASSLILTLGVGVTVAIAGDEATASQTEDRRTTDATPKPVLDGGKVYAWNCGSCHSERWPKERSDAEWDVIMPHMRVRANMTTAQTEAVLRYLKENN